MIALSTITNRIETQLNAMSNKEFKLFTDIGEFKHYYKADNSNNVTKYINGIVETLTPSILPIKNLEVVTQSIRITFALDIALMNKDENGEFIEVQQVRSILTNYIKNNNGIPYTLEEDTKTFEITPTFNGVTVGIASQLSPIGNVLPMYFDFSCLFIESGVNTNSINFIVNGENMYYQEYSATRTRTAETNMLANKQNQKTIVQANGLSLNLKMPLLDTAQSKLNENDVWNGTQNEAICVERHRPNAIKPYDAYIMIYGNNNETGSMGQNVGQVIDLVEGQQKLLTYGANWSQLTITTTAENQVYTLSLPNTNYCVIFWGDNETDHIDTANRMIYEKTHTYGEVGTYTIRVYSYEIPFKATSELTYTLEDDNTYSVSGIDADWTGGKIYIPSNHLGLPVVTIDNNAFYTNTLVTSVEIQDLTLGESFIISGSAFDECSALTEITLPVGLTEIGANVFDGCFDLYTVNYKGTMEQWNEIELNENWRGSSPFTVVHCSDGDVELGA